jgi:hypothetical protein
MQQKNRTLEAKRGSYVWGFNQFRMTLLSSFIGDLAALEVKGLEYNDCQAVKGALSTMIRATENGNEGAIWKESLKQRFEEFYIIYRDWNDHEGEDPKIITERRKELRKLVIWRDRFSERTAKFQYELYNSNDLELVKAIYEAVRTLSERYPDYFPKLRSALLNLEKKRKSRDF